MSTTTAMPRVGTGPFRRIPAAIVVSLLFVAVAGVAALPNPALAASVPSAPTNVVVTVGHSGWAEVDWHRPASDGGSAILGWVIRSSPTDPGDDVVQVADYGDHISTQRIVEYGDTYQFAVAALNDVGIGPWSESSPPVTPSPLVTIESTNMTEGDTGTHPMTFAVKLDFPSAQPVTMSYATGRAGAGTDFLATSGTLTFTPGQAEKTISVPIVGDTRYETKDKVTVRLSRVSGAVFRTWTAIGTIVNDDPLPALQVVDASKAEGANGTSTKVKVPVTLSVPSGAVTKVHWKTSNGTATAGTDYRAGAGTLRIGAGMTTATIVITVLGDGVVEPGETILVDLDSPVGATIADGHAAVTIRNDD